MSESAEPRGSKSGDDGWGGALVLVLVMAAGGAGGWMFLTYKSKVEAEARIAAKAEAAAETARAYDAVRRAEAEAAALRRAEKEKETEAARRAPREVAPPTPPGDAGEADAADSPAEEERRRIQANLWFASVVLEAFAARTPAEAVQRNKLLAEIAVAQSRAKAAEKAKQTLETAINVFPKGLPTEEAAAALLPLVQAMLVLEDQDGAWSLLAEIRRDSLRDAILLDLTDALLESGREAEARTALAQVRRPAERCRGLLKVVLHEASPQAPLKPSTRETLLLAQEALAQSNLPAEQLLRTDLIPSLAKALVYAGEYDQARRTAEPIAAPWVKIELLLHEAKVRAARKDVAGAAETLAEAERRIAAMDVEAERIIPWIEVAELRRTVGPPAAASQALASAREAAARLQPGDLPAGQVDSAVPHVRAAALARIARVERRSGAVVQSKQDLQAAFQEVEGIPTAEERAAARLDVGEAQIEGAAAAADFASARAALDLFAAEIGGVSPPAARAELWVRATALASAAQHPKLAAWLEAARLSAVEVPLSGERGRLYRTLFADLVRAGDGARAQRFAEAEKAELSKAQALLGVGEGRLDLWEASLSADAGEKKDPAARP